MIWDEDAEKLKHKETAIETMISHLFLGKAGSGSRNNPTFSVPR